MPIVRSILVAALALGGLVSVDVFLDIGGSYTFTCEGGVSGVEFGPENDLTVECALGDGAHVICASPGVIGWSSGPDDQITVTCAGEPKP